MRGRGLSEFNAPGATPAARNRLFSAFGSRLWHAETEVRPTRALLHDAPNLTVADAYAIRAEVDTLRMTHGAIPIGRKIGLAARELQTMAGVDEPFWAYIFNTGEIATNAGHARLNLARYLLPRIEPEIALTLRHDLDGPIITRGDIAAAIGSIAPALELIDARSNATGFSVVEIVADSGANAGFLLGAPIPVAGVDLGTLEQVAVSVRSQQDPGLDRAGAATSLMDGPLGCLLWLARHTLARGEPLRCGETVLTGTLAGAIPVRPDDTLTVEFSGLGPGRQRLVVTGG